MLLGLMVLTADMPETDRLWPTLTAGWEAIEVLVVTEVTNASTEAANTSIKQIKRTGRGYPCSYPARQRRPDGSVNTYYNGPFTRNREELGNPPGNIAAQWTGPRTVP